MRNISILSLLILAAAAMACGGDTQDQTDAGDDGATADGDQSDAAADVADDADHGQVSTTYPAFKVDAPQVEFAGGSILVSPKVVPVYFGNDDHDVHRSDHDVPRQAHDDRGDVLVAGREANTASA